MLGTFYKLLGGEKKQKKLSNCLRPFTEELIKRLKQYLPSMNYIPKKGK